MGAGLPILPRAGVSSSVANRLNEIKRWMTTLKNHTHDGVNSSGLPDYGGRNSYSIYIDGTLSVASDVIGFVIGEPVDIDHVRLRTFGDVPTGANLIVDIHKNGTTMFTTQGNRPTIIASESSETSPAPDVTSLEEGDYVTIDIDQVGSGDAGSNLGVTLVCE